MPAKRTAATKAPAKAPAAKKVKAAAAPATLKAGLGQSKANADADGPAAVKTAMEKAISNLQHVAQKKLHKPDPHFSLGGEVVDDFNAMLNQTDIGNNNNKFFVIQVLKVGSNYYCFTRWGRVGESGQSQQFGPFTDVKNAVEVFEKKFKDKTKNAWAKREQFQTYTGKYTMIDVGEFEDAAGGSGAETSRVEAAVAPVNSGPVKTLASKLDAETQKLMKMIFDNDMFKEAMEDMKLDVKKMPLGQLSKVQIFKGFQVLEELEQAINSAQPSSKLQELSSKFFTAIPHSFGRQRPPTISTADKVRELKDTLLVLSDIEEAQTLQKKLGGGATPNAKNEVLNPLDQKYALLDCDLRRVQPNETEWKLIEKYTNETASHSLKILDIWRVDRHSEGMRFRTRAHLGNHKLLWHGTNIAVIVAILKGGLRIMPHSGGRVGRGLYFASENGKSAGYVQATRDGVGVMFLNEVILGKPHTIKMDDSSLTKPPNGCDSVVAVGQTEPDPSQDVTYTFEDGYVVTVPQGKPVKRPDGHDSRFSQSEYLVYDEAQCRIRYMLTVKF